MNSLACVAGSFLGETFINIYTALQGQTKKKWCLLSSPLPRPPLFSGSTPVQLACGLSLNLRTTKEKTNKQKNTIYAGYELWDKSKT